MLAIGKIDDQRPRQTLRQSATRRSLATRSGVRRRHARALWRANSASADIATLFAEAAMDLHPWNYWDKGLAQPWTGEIVESLETALRLDPKHPGANHYYIHIVEASATPGRALAAADRLRHLVPDSSLNFHHSHVNGVRKLIPI